MCSAHFQWHRRPGVPGAAVLKPRVEIDRCNSYRIEFETTRRGEQATITNTMPCSMHMAMHDALSSDSTTAQPGYTPRCSRTFSDFTVAHIDDSRESATTSTTHSSRHCPLWGGSAQDWTSHFTTCVCTGPLRATRRMPCRVRACLYMRLHSASTLSHVMTRSC